MFTYDPAVLGTTPLYQVRLLIGDTEATNVLVQDEEIIYMLGERGTANAAAASLCRSLAAKFAREADVSDRDIRTSLSQRSASYLRMAKEYEDRADVSGGAAGILVAGLPDALSAQQFT